MEPGWRLPSTCSLRYPVQVQRVGMLVLLAAFAFGIAYTITKAIQCRTPVQVGESVSASSAVSLSDSTLGQGPAVQSDAHRLAPPGMVWVPGGEFLMGTDDLQAHPAEQPAHWVRVSGFWIDRTEVANADFARFVEATK